MAGKPARNKKNPEGEAPKAEKPKMSKGEFTAEDSGSSKTGTIENGLVDAGGAENGLVEAAVETGAAEAGPAESKLGKASTAKLGKASTVKSTKASAVNLGKTPANRVPESKQAQAQGGKPQNESPKQSSAKRPKTADDEKPKPSQTTGDSSGPDTTDRAPRAKKPSSKNAKAKSSHVTQSADLNSAAESAYADAVEQQGGRLHETQGVDAVLAEIEAAALDAEQSAEHLGATKSRPRHFKSSSEPEPLGRHSAEARGKHSAEQDYQPRGKHMAHARHSAEVEHQLLADDHPQINHQPQEPRPFEYQPLEPQPSNSQPQEPQLYDTMLQELQPLNGLVSESGAASAIAETRDGSESTTESGYQPGKYSYINLTDIDSKEDSTEESPDDLRFEDVFGEDADTEFNSLFDQAQASAGAPAFGRLPVSDEDEMSMIRRQCQAIEQAAAQDNQKARRADSKKPMKAAKRAKAADRTDSTNTAKRRFFNKTAGPEDSQGGFKPITVSKSAIAKKLSAIKPGKAAKPNGRSAASKPNGIPAAARSVTANPGKPGKGGGGSDKKRKGTLLLVAGIAFILIALGIGAFLVSKYFIASLSTQQAVDASGLNLDGGSDSLAPDMPVDELNINWDSLRSINSDIVGWVIIPGTVINYPVVQTDNNDFYLNHIFDKTYNEAGSIFLDYENSPTIKGWNNIIYGHNLLDGKMFTSLKQYTNQDFYNEHKTILVATPEMNYKLEVVAVLVCDAEDKIRRFGFNSRQEYSTYVNMLTEYAVINDIGEELPEYLYCFATCTGTNYMKRTMILAKLVEETPPPGSASGENGSAQGASGQGLGGQGANGAAAA